MALTRTQRAVMGIAECKAIGQAHDHQAVVIITVARDGEVRVSSWGRTKRKCDAIGPWAQGLWKHAISVVPFRTVFGWGNRGVPRPLTGDERATLSDAGRAFDQLTSCQARGSGR